MPYTTIDPRTPKSTWKAQAEGTHKRPTSALAKPAKAKKRPTILTAGTPGLAALIDGVSKSPVLQKRSQQKANFRADAPTRQQKLAAMQRDHAAKFAAGQPAKS